MPIPVSAIFAAIFYVLATIWVKSSAGSSTVSAIEPPVEGVESLPWDTLLGESRRDDLLEYEGVESFRRCGQ